MPNTPLLVSEGATAVTRGAHATDEDLAYAKELFACLGLASSSTRPTWTRSAPSADRVPPTSPR